jgi:glyoxylase-like metal-dependent hydrolase (beta-lactamase superfamily II)
MVGEADGLEPVGARQSTRLTGQWLHPQRYAGDGWYRPPSGWYRRLNHLGVPLTSHGLAPRDAVTLQVRGRRTGRLRSTPVLVTRFEGKEYLVALAGESQWVRNVRAADGIARIRRRGSRAVRLIEVPVDERAAVLAAYLEAGRRRSGERAAGLQAKWYFGLDDAPTRQQLADLAPRYPVFRVTDADPQRARTDAHRLLVQEIAPGVVCVGPWGRTRTTVHLVQGDGGWALIDAGWAGDATRIEAAVDDVLGPGNVPDAILLTHAHPDHSGAARTLADRWSCPVYLHPDELPIASGDLAAMGAVAAPLDRWVVLPIMRVMGRLRGQEPSTSGHLAGIARTLTPGDPVPSLPQWQVVATPGHTPGHLSFFRPSDRVLISGDALVNVRVNDALGLLRGQPGLSCPPWYTTWDRRLAASTVRHLAALEPAVLGCGHGPPLTGADTASRIHRFADGVAGPRSARSAPTSAMTRIAGEVLIEAPITVVFDTVADERNEPLYNPRITRAQKVTDGAVGAGTRFSVEAKGAGRGGEMAVEIMEFERPRRLRNVISSSAMDVDGILNLEPTPHGTRLSWDWGMRLRGPFRALTPVLALIGPRWERRNWIGLKDYLEGQAHSADEARLVGGARTGRSRRVESSALSPRPVRRHSRVPTACRSRSTSTGSQPPANRLSGSDRHST